MTVIDYLTSMGGVKGQVVYVQRIGDSQMLKVEFEMKSPINIERQISKLEATLFTVISVPNDF